ncbi:MAG: hypothetical protein OHK0023_06240 [Anaerolineae bacterium]
MGRNSAYNTLPGTLIIISAAFIIITAIYFPNTLFGFAALLGGYIALRQVAALFANLIGVWRVRQSERRDWYKEYERRKRPDSLEWADVRHLVVIPSYKENIQVLRDTLRRLAESPLAKTHVIIALAMEGRDPNAVSTAEKLLAEFRGNFLRIMYSIHPPNLPGEARVKGANETWAMRMVRHEVLDVMKISRDNLVVTTIDADTLLHPKYLEALSCKFAAARAERRYAYIWQAPIRYHNNVWDVPPSLSLINAYSSAWEMAYLAGFWWHSIPISSYSLSYRLLEESGFWDVDVVADDWHIFLKAFFLREGRTWMRPIFLPFTGYATTGDNFLDACRNRYQQTVRHAWGATEIGYTLRQMSETNTPAYRAIPLFLRVIHDHILASCGWLIVALGAQVPLVLPGVPYDQPLMWVARAALAISVITGLGFWWLDFYSRPPREKPLTLVEAFITVISFPLLPVLTFFLLAMPAIEAQMRLFFNAQRELSVARKV